MKKQLLVIFTVLLCSVINAQYIPNGGFEDWTRTVVSEEAYQWNTGYANENDYSIIPATLKTTRSHSGDFGLELDNFVQGTDTMFSFAMCGGMITNIANLDAVEYIGGFSVTSAPDSVYGYFKDSIPDYKEPEYDVEWADTATFFISFKRNGVLIHQQLFPLLGIHSDYTKLGFDIATMAQVPDTCIIAIVSTSPFYPRPQSKLLVDSLWFSGAGNPIPNSGFEVWEEFGDETPDHWITDNETHSLILKDAMVTPSADEHSGVLAARIESVTTGSEVKGLLQLSMLDTTQTGFPVIFKPLFLDGYYKFSHVLNDTAMIQVTLFSATDSINTFTTKLLPAINYTYFQIPFTYPGNSNIEKVKITAVTTTNYSAGTGYQGEEGSVLYLDDIDLVTPCDTFTQPNIYAPVSLCSGGDILAVTGIWDSYSWSTGETTSTITDLATQPYKVTVKHGYCSFTDSLVVPSNTIIGLPTASPLQNFCESAAISNLSAIPGSYATDVDWYADLVGGTILPGSTALVNGSTYYAQSRNSSTGCISGSRRAVVVAIYQKPTSNVTGSTSICSGSGTDISIILTGNSTWNLTYTDGVLPVNVGVQVNDTLIVHVTPGTTRTYSVVDLSDAYCTGTSFGSTATIIVSTLPVTSDITGNTTLVCSAVGETYSVDPNPANKFSWSVPSGSTILTDTSALGVNSIQVNFGTTSSDISVYQVNPNGCAGSTKNLAITLTGCPFEANFAASSTDICPNDTVIFTSTSIGTSPFTTYAWNFGTDGNPATATGIGPHKVVYPVSGNKEVELTITDGSSDTETKTDYIGVRTLPLIELTDAQSCGDGPIQFTATTIGGNYIEFSVDNGITVDGWDNSSPFEYAPEIQSEDTIYIVGRAISNIGCIGEWSSAASGISYPLPQTGILNTHFPATLENDSSYLDIFCYGETKTYFVDPGDADSYLWTFNDLGISETAEDEISVVWDIPGGKHLISVAAISAEGCIGEPTIDSIFISTPTVDIGQGLISICEGTSHIFNTIPLFATYAWSDGSVGPQLVITTEDTINVIVTDMFGCRAKDSAIVVVNPSPFVSLGNDTMLCDDGGYVLETGDFESYQWSTGDNGSSITIYPGGQVLTLTVTDDNGCQDVDTLFITACTPLLLDEISNVFTPNGDDNHETWEINGIELFPHATIDVFDRWGRRVYHKENGYHNDWGGKFNGKPLPMDNYYYVIDFFGDGKHILKGNVTIVK